MLRRIGTIKDKLGECPTWDDDVARLLRIDVIGRRLAVFRRGAVVSGSLADRFSRRMVIVTSVFWFGAWTLMELRFVAGLTLPDADGTAVCPVRTFFLPRYRFGTTALWLSYFLVCSLSTY